jgi:hypothetical protein
MRTGENTAIRLLPPSSTDKNSETKLSVASKQLLKATKAPLKKGPEIKMPPQESCYIKPPRHDFF